MKVDAVFRLASMTKPIISVAILRLLDQKRIHLDDPVAKWLPDFKPLMSDGSTPVILIRHLLTHTAGLNYGFSEKSDGPYHRTGVSDGFDKSGITLDENLNRISRVPLLFKPGTKWRYSVATDVLGRIIEKVTETDLENAVRDLITDPLKMKNTKFRAKKSDILVTPYADGKSEPIRMGDHFLYPIDKSAISFSPDRAFDQRAYLSGGTGMIGNADEYVKFLETIRTGGSPLLEEETNRMIFKNFTGDLPISTVGLGWGFGLLSSAVLVDAKEAKSPFHKGSITWGGAYGHTWWIDPESKLTVVILTNTAIAGGLGIFPNDIRDAIYLNLQ